MRLHDPPRHDLDVEMPPRCGHPLDLEFDVEKPRAATSRELMKVLPVRRTINLGGEGYTPLIRRGGNMDSKWRD